MLEAEFGEPFVDIVRGMREQGCSWTTITNAMEVPMRTLRTWLKGTGLLDGSKNFEPRTRPDSLDARAHKLGYLNAEQMITDLRMQGKTRADIGALLDCHPQSLYRHTSQEAKEMTVHTERQIEVRRRIILEVNRKRRENYVNGR